MLRILGSLALLVALSGHAADVPLSDRPLAPLTGIGAVSASASGELVLVAFNAGKDVFAQRFDAEGRSVDETAFYIGTGQGSHVVWDGRRWLVFFGRSPLQMAYVDPSGSVQSIHDLQILYPVDAAVIDGRVFVAAGSAPPRLYEIVDGPTVIAREVATHSTDPQRTWIVGLSDGPDLVMYRARHGTFWQAAFSVVGEERLFPMTVGASNATFVASPDGGGLLAWNESGMRGAILRPDSTISPAFSIGPAGNVYEGVEAVGREGGWDLFFVIGGVAWTAAVSPDGVVDAHSLETPTPFAWWSYAIASVGDGHLLFQPVGDPLGGLRSEKILGLRIEPRSRGGIGDAGQFLARSASGSGMDVVVWTEQGEDGPVLKATRIPFTGDPLDGEGRLVASEPWSVGPNHGDQFDVAFDGEEFLIAWIENGPDAKIVMRRFSPDGTLSDRTTVAAWHGIGGIDVAGAAGGRAAISWVGNEDDSTRVRSVLIPVDRGVPGEIVIIAPAPPLGWSLPRLVANHDRFLAVFFDNYECRITCAFSGTPHGRFFSLDGEPLSETVKLSAGTGSPEVVSDGFDFFVSWGNSLVRVSPEFVLGPERTLVHAGALSIDDGDIRIDHGIVRAVYDRNGYLVRFEPLRLRGDDERAAPLSGDRLLVRVPAHPERFYIRSLADFPPVSADLAIVPTGATIPETPYGDAKAVFRVEHRGGARVTRIQLWSGHPISLPNADRSYAVLTLDRELLEGESFEVLLTLYSYSAQPPIWVAGDVVDPLPGNNVDSFQRVSHPRRRLAGR